MYVGICCHAENTAPIFTFTFVYDNRNKMVVNPQKFDSEHPLLVDEDRLERIADVMYAKIQQTLFGGSRGRRPRIGREEPSDSNAQEKILAGTAFSADDVLSEALTGLLQYSPQRLRGTWEGLAVRIAEYKAIDAIRASKAGLRGTDHRPPLQLISGDIETEGPEGEKEPTILETLPGNWHDPEAEFMVKQDVLKLRDLAREMLNGRDQDVFFAIHFLGLNRSEVGNKFGMTGQRAGQIYNAALRELEAHPDYPF